MGAADPMTHPIILFDGVCNLCNSSVQFIIRHDPKSTFRFAALQSDTGKKYMNEFGIAPDMLSSVILIGDGKAYQKSRAALEIARNLSGGWPAFYVFMAVPSFLRDWVYDYVSRNRYRMFGKREECMIPTPDLKSRFI
jgi:predicted DCC family thiol-disulfide oxidoreductase YuxK